MEELMGRSPVAHDHLAQIDPALQEELSGHILALNHEILGQDNFEWIDYSTPIPEEQRTPEQHEQHDRVTGFMELAAGLTKEAHQLLAEQRKLTASTEAISAEEVIKTAKSLALDGAEAAKLKGDEEATKVAIRGFLVVGLLDDRQSGYEWAQESGKADSRDVVRRGLANELVDGVVEMKGVVAVGGGSDVIESRSRFDSAAPLLKVVTGRDVREGTKIDPEEQHKAEDELGSSDLMVLAEKSKRESNIEMAKKRALKALEEIDGMAYSSDASEVARVIKTARDIYKDPKTGELSPDFVKQISLLRARRLPGNYYRGNSQVAHLLDGAIVSLTVDGDFDLAYELLSSTNKEFKSSDNPEAHDGNLDYAVRLGRDVGLSDDQKQEVLGTLRKLHAQKQHEFRQALHSHGASDGVVDSIIRRSDDPDSAIGVNQQFWQDYDSLPQSLRDAVVNARDISETCSAIELLVGQELQINESTLDRVIGLMLAQPDKEKQQEYLQSIGTLVNTIKQHIDAIKTTGQYVDGRLSDRILTSYLEFDRPSDALQFALDIYGEKGVEVGYQLKQMLEKTYGERLVQLDERRMADVKYMFEKLSMLEGTSIDRTEVARSALSRSEGKEYVDDIAHVLVSSEIQEILGDPNLAGLKDLVLRKVVYSNKGEREETVKKFQDILSLEGVKVLIEPGGVLERDAATFVGALLSEQSPAELVSKISGIFGSEVFSLILQDAGPLEGKKNLIKSGVLAHIDEWGELINIIPEGNAGRLLRSQIIDRLSIGLNALHEDPSQSIRVFTELKVDEPLRSELREQNIQLISQLLGAEGVRGFPSAKPTKTGEVFYDEELAGLYRQLYALKQSGDQAAAQELIVSSGIQLSENAGDLTELLGNLREGVGAARDQEKAAQNWLRQYSGQTISSNKLIQAWNSRRLALENDVADNPTAILGFVAENGVKIFYENLRKAGSETITEEEFEQQLPVIREMGSSYAPATAMKAVERRARYLREHDGKYPEKIIGNNKGEFVVGDRSFSAEILSADDPRGFTIGVDTGCCMTLGGASESCIWAGYEDPRYSFFAVYQEGKLRAQSVMYVAEVEGQRILVVDNIEANEGTDLSAISQVYKSALVEFIQKQGVKVDAVHIGVGYTQAELLAGLEVAGVTPSTPLEGVYSDARSQRVLWKREA